MKCIIKSHGKETKMRRKNEKVQFIFRKWREMSIGTRTYRMPSSSLVIPNKILA